MLFDFYDKRLPADIVSQRHFDSWWKKIAKTQGDLLNFEKAFLTQDKGKISELDFPNFWQQGNIKLKLSYQFDPTLENDGVTVHIPLPLLNQVEMTGFDWQIPALREELVITLIKALPKNVRKNFVPAPNYAQAFLARCPQQATPLIDCLVAELRKMTGVTIDKTLWDGVALPPHLTMTFQVIDEKGQKIAENRCIDVLKVALKDRIQQTLSSIVDDGIEQTGIHLWNFDELPRCYEQKKQGFCVKAYPALVEEKESVGIKLFETESEQMAAMQAGLRRLLLLNVPSPIKYLHEKLPNKAKLGLYFTPFGQVVDLIDDCIAASVDQLIEDFGGVVWQQKAFDELRDFVRANLNEKTCLIAQQVEEILTLSFEINKRLKGKLDFTLAFAFSDIKKQISQLIYPNFVTQTRARRLKDVKRYFLAIQKRIEKLMQDPNRDRAMMLKVENVQQHYSKLLAKLPQSKAIPKDISDIRYMIEELRVSLFAQQLGTPYPVSDKRILLIIEELK